MSIKNSLVKTTRRVLPKKVVKKLENNYRKNRAKLVSSLYGNPASKLKIIAVTGTNGKTTTVNFLNEILKEAGYKTAMFSTANIEINGNQIRNDLNATVSTSKRMNQFFSDAVKQNVEFALIEATSHALSQYKLYGISIEMAIMTNLTQDHLDYHKTMDNYAKAKSILFKMKPKYIVLNKDDDWFNYFNNFRAVIKKITYGKDKEADMSIENIKLYKKGSEAKLKIEKDNIELATNLAGEFNVYNMTAAAAGAYLLGVSKEDIQEGIANLENIAGRFERVDGNQPFEVIVDYAHTPDALEKLLKTAKKITKNNVIIVFGACGDRDKKKRPIMGDIAFKNADKIFITDEESYNEDPNEIRKQILNGITDNKDYTKKVEEIADRQEAIEKALSIAKKDDTVLITGMGHEVYRIINGKKIPWNDAEVVKKILNKK